MKGGSSPRDKLLDDKDDLKVDLDSSFSHSHGKSSSRINHERRALNIDTSDELSWQFAVFIVDLGSNDSYGTVVDMGLTVDGSSPRHGHYLHGGASTPPYLSSSHSPPSGHPGIGHQFPYHSEGLSVYTSIGKFCIIFRSLKEWLRFHCRTLKKIIQLIRQDFKN